MLGSHMERLSMMRGNFVRYGAIEFNGGWRDGYRRQAEIIFGGVAAAQRPRMSYGAFSDKHTCGISQVFRRDKVVETVHPDVFDSHRGPSITLPDVAAAASDGFLCEVGDDESRPDAGCWPFIPSGASSAKCITAAGL